MDALPPLEGMAGGDVGPELAAILQSIADITVPSGPKYSPAVCRRLVRWIVCRSYAGPLRELCHLVTVAERSGGRQGYEMLFWGGDAASAASFCGHFTTLERSGRAAGMALLESRVRVRYPDGTFDIAFTRMPFLSALMEFLVTALGYGEVDALLRAVPAGASTLRSVDETANGLARRLYGWLAVHLPAAQAQRKFRAALSFLRQRTDEAVQPDHVDDDAVLAFWIVASTDDGIDGDFRSYITVFRLMVAVRDALAAAAVRRAMCRARPIGGDPSAGETGPGDIDPNDVDAALGPIHERRAPLEALAAPPASAVKFLKRTEARSVALIAEAGEAAFALPLSILRAQVFGAIQTRISQALRRGTDPVAAGLLDDVADGIASYAEQLRRIGGLGDYLDQALLASFHHLIQAGHAEAVGIMLDLRPDIDLTPLLDMFEDRAELEGDIVQLHPAAPPGLQLLRICLSDPARCPDLADLLRSAASAARRITRKGFDRTSDPRRIAAFAAASDALLALRKTVRRFARLAGAKSCLDRRFRADRAIFQAQFHILYGDRR